MPSLNTPLLLGDARLRNRNVMSAMTRNRASANVPNQYNSDYYTQRAAGTGGAGLIVTEGTLVSQQG
jgi:2,4-dienoyl-CoA reductase-like NADH-dependent reductase (Old Yellow Enzyme family)